MQPWYPVKPPGHGALGDGFAEKTKCSVLYASGSVLYVNIRISWQRH